MFIMSNKELVGQHVTNINTAVSRMSTAMDTITKTVTSPELMASGANAQEMLANADQLARAVATFLEAYTGLGQAHTAAAEDLQLLDQTLARSAGAGAAGPTRTV